MKYLGAKGSSGLYQAIINLMPPHDTYIEPFLGTGVVLRKKAPALRSIGIDLKAECLEYVRNCYSQVELINEDAIVWLDSMKVSGRTVIYCDPPYVQSTRTSSKRYEHELSDEQHIQLLKVLKGIDAFIIISGYHSELYNDLLSDWSRLDIQAMSRGGVRTESIWYNFNPGKMHYHTFVGKDANDRKRIKEKAKRWRRNFQSLPPGEKQALFSALISDDEDLQDGQI